MVQYQVISASTSAACARERSVKIRFNILLKMTPRIYAEVYIVDRDLGETGGEEIDRRTRPGRHGWLGTFSCIYGADVHHQILRLGHMETLCLTK